MIDSKGNIVLYFLVPSSYNSIVRLIVANNKTITIAQASVCCETSKAICIEWKNNREIWLPKSQVVLTQDHDGDFVEGHDWKDGSGVGYVSVTLPTWLAAKNRMLY